MDILIPKGHTSSVCKNERQRSAVGGEVSIEILKSQEGTYVAVIEDHVTGTKKVTPVMQIRELEVLKDVIVDLLWKAKVK